MADLDSKFRAKELPQVHNESRKKHENPLLKLPYMALRPIVPLSPLGFTNHQVSE